jgi:predicted extracellular nuclease
MKIKIITILIIAILLVMSFTYTQPSRADTGDPVLINEFLASHTGTDNTEYVELYGDPGTSLSGLSLIVVEGDAIGLGTIDRRYDFQPLQVIGPNGFFLFGNCQGLEYNYAVTPDASLSNDYFENSSLTLALVETSSLSGSVGDQITGSEVVRDSVALTDGGTGDDFFFGAPVIGPDGTFFPAGARRIVDGVDTNTAADWVLADFNLGAANTPTGGGFDGCGPPAIPLTISEIQGGGQFSDYQGESVVTEGVVTLISANGSVMWIQDPMGDGDPATSDGILVAGISVLPDPQIGDLVRITATVEEQQFYPALPLTRLINPRAVLFEIISSGNPLPAPVPLIDLPNQSILEGINFWEPLESMLVSITNGFVVFPTNAYGEFVMLTEMDANADLRSGFYAQTQQIFLVDLEGDEVDYNPERIMVDDSTLSTPIQVFPGDRVRSLVGVVDYTFGNYKLQPASYELKTQKLPKMPVSTRSDGFGDTSITTFNVENLFDLELNVPTPVDVIGQVGYDPGSQWGSGDTSTADNTIRRKSTICAGDTNPSDAFDPALEWDGYPLHTWDGLGSHTESCGSATDLFFSEYSEGYSFNKVVEIYNGTGEAVNLGASRYAVVIYFNGNSSPGQTIYLSGTLEPGDVYVLAHTDADPVIKAVADQLSGQVLFNGDDAVVLRKGGKDDASSTPTAAELEIKLTKLEMAIQVEMNLPEILIVQEVENTAILQELGNRVNMANGTNYMAVSFETSDARGIEVGFLWDANRVTLLDAYQMYGPDVEAAFGFSSDSPGREPLVGVFEIEGKSLTIIGNHLKSKGGDDPLFSVYWPPIRYTEEQRKAQATVVRNFVNAILDADPNALVMVAGDLNDFQFGEPGEGDDHPIAILEGINGGVPLIDLINLEKIAERFTYTYDGNSQVLDHMLISPGLYNFFVGTDVLHFDATYPNYLSLDASTVLHVSDHDPLEGRFLFGK